LLDIPSPILFFQYWICIHFYVQSLKALSLAINDTYNAILGDIVARYKKKHIHPSTDDPT